MTELRSLIEVATPDMDAIAAHLDGLGHTERVRQVRTLGRRAQARLFDAASGYRALSLTDIVPEAVPDMTPVTHLGKNTLPVLTHFAKVFARPDDGDHSQLWGYNSSGAFVGAVVGPGYFVLHDHDVEGELLVDYLMLPPRAPAGWPAILPNSARLSRVVYYGMQDVLRGVSEHVTIGRATKGGKNMNAWFALCREDL